MEAENGHREIEANESSFTNLDLKERTSNQSSAVEQLIIDYLSQTIIKVRRDILPLTQQTLIAIYFLLRHPFFDVSKFNLDQRVKEKLIALQQIPFDDQGKIINIFALINQSKLDQEQKVKWLQAQITSRYEWIEYQDILDLLKKLTEEEVKFKPHTEPDEYSPHRVKNPERLDQSKEYLALIAPFWGGYYRDGRYEIWNSAKLQWKKAERKYHLLDGLTINQDCKKNYISSAAANLLQTIKLPYNWGIDPQSIRWLQKKPQKFDFFQDQNGQIYLYIQDEQTKAVFPYSIEIGPTTNNVSPKLILAEISNDLMPEPLLQIAESIMRENITAIGKARKIVGAIRDHLEYDESYFYETLYKKNPQEYFCRIWSYKKAKCDEANTLAAVLLRNFGFQTHYISGHFTKEKHNDAAVLRDSNRHGWIEVYDESSYVWVRLDATPKGDPNLDEKEQNSDRVEGDFGEEEAQIISAEELERLISELSNIEAGETPEQLELRFAEEARCSLEEAREILKKIQKLRSLKDNQGRIVYQEAKKIWRKATIKNLRMQEVYLSPVTMSQGEELSDPAITRIDITTGVTDPSGFEYRQIQEIQEKYFGGFEVYILADLSASMNQIDSNCGIRKNEAQRDSIFLFVDSLMANAVLSKHNQNQLQSLMPIKVCVISFGQKTQIILPLSDQWGPAEQIRLYRALNAIPDGSTPDHQALLMTMQQINQSKASEENQQRRAKIVGKRVGKLNRFVAVFADGGSDIKTEVRRHVQTLRKDGIVVWGFGITESSKEMIASYQPDVEIIPKAADLTTSGLGKLIETVKKWYDIT